MALGLALAASAGAGENWPSFQNGGAVSFAEGADSGEMSVAWTAAIPGYGQSSPIAWEGRVYVTSVSGANKETFHVTAYRLKDGQKLWRHDVPNASPQENSNYVSKAAPTPIADESGVICFFEGGNVLALTHGGDVRWERNLVKDYGAIDARHGLGSSVEQTARTAFIWVERQTEPYVLALEKATGQTLWKVPGLGATSWASARLIAAQGTQQHLVLSGVGKLVGLDPATGERLWSFDEISGNSTPTPIPLGEGRFLIGATVGRGEASSGRAAESNGVIALHKSADGAWTARYLWKAERATSSFGSPIAHAGNAYFVNASGVLYCLDAETGKEHYVQRLAGSIWATPIAQGDRIWLFGKDGTVTSIHSGETFQTLNQRNIFSGGEPGADAEPTLYAAAACGHSLLIRSGDRLVCLRP